MDKFKPLLDWAATHPEALIAAGAFAIEILTRKLPGTITALHMLSKILDKVPGLENKK